MELNIMSDTEGRMDSERKFGKLIKEFRNFSKHFEFYGYTIDEIKTAKLKVPVMKLPNHFSILLRSLRDNLFYREGMDATGWTYIINDDMEPIALIFLHNWNQTAYPSDVRGREEKDAYINRKEMQWESMLREKIPNEWDVSERHDDDRAQDGQYIFTGLKPDVF